MSKYILIIYKRYQRFIKYSIIGLTGATLDFILFLIFNKHFRMYYQLANIISVSVGITNNFILNVKFNFEVKDDLFIRFLKFYSVGIFGLGLTAILLLIMVEMLHWQILVSKMVTILLVPIIQFQLNKTIT